MDSQGIPVDGVVGDVDRQPRFAQLRQFISGSSLTIEEYRYIKVLLSGVNIDIISELPIEIVVQVAKWLDLHHFINCLAVSRRWRDKFLSGPVMDALMSKFCPSFAQIPKNTLATTSEGCLQVLHKIGRAQWADFRSRFQKPFKWEYESYFQLDAAYHGTHENTATIYSQLGHPSTDPEPDRFAFMTTLYSNGKIAWLAKPYTVVVDCIWSRTRKIFKLSTGQLIGPLFNLLALGDRLVVGSVDRTVVAWDHVANIFREKKLPGSVKRVTTEGYRVAIVLYSGDVFLWEFSGGISTLATAPIMEHHDFDSDTFKSWKSNLCVIFHPSCSRTLFLASGHTSHVDFIRVLKRVVYEFKDLNHVKTFEFESSPHIHNITEPRSVEVEIRKVLPYRRDIIGFYEDYEAFIPPDPRILFCYETFVEFDIYDRKFTARVDEEFDHAIFGWPCTSEGGDLDFFVRFARDGLFICSYLPDFDFKVGE